MADQSESHERSHTAKSHLRHRVKIIGTLCLVIVGIYEFRVADTPEETKAKLNERLNADKESLRHAADAAPGSVFAIAGDIRDHYYNCENRYRYFVYCPLGEGPAVRVALPENPGCRSSNSVIQGECNLVAPVPAASSSWFNGVLQPIENLVKLFLTVLQTAPRIPDAAIYIMRQRWGHPAEFGAALSFVAIWLAMFILSFRQKYPDNLMALAGSVLAGPYLILALFALLSLLPRIAGYGVDRVAGWILGGVTSAGVALLSIRGESAELVEAIKVSRRAAAIEKLKDLEKLKKV